MQQFINQLIRIVILYKGYIDNIKQVNNTRLLIINPHSIRPSNEEKINMLIHSYESNQIDGLILS